MYSERINKLLEDLSISVGDHVKLNINSDEFEGILMPRPDAGDDNIIVIKRKDGYNMGIRADGKIKIAKISGKKETFAFPKSRSKPDELLPKVSLIYTGGTIGSKVDYTVGGVYMLTKPEELLNDVPEVGSIANISINPLLSIASEDMSFVEWQKIADAIEKELKKDAQGIIVTHGTDTMHYTAAALSFMLTNLNTPVAITGSQRSSDRGSSDAFMNLICSAYAAANSNIAEVGICMHSGSSDNSCDYIRGTKARKMHTTRRDAFKAVNSKPIAFVKHNGEITYNSDYKKVDRKTKEKLVVKSKFESKVALIKMYPNSDPDILKFYMDKGYKGAILEGTGMGHGPVSTIHKEFNWLPAIKEAVGHGMLLGMTSQCIFGRVNTNVYRNLRLISSTGVIYCEDMTPETAFVKLGWLLGNYKAEEANKLLGANMVGEISERTEFEE